MATRRDIFGSNGNFARFAMPVSWEELFYEYLQTNPVGDPPVFTINIIQPASGPVDPRIPLKTRSRIEPYLKRINEILIEDKVHSIIMKQNCWLPPTEFEWRSETTLASLIMVKTQIDKENSLYAKAAKEGWILRHNKIGGKPVMYFPKEAYDDNGHQTPLFEHKTALFWSVRLPDHIKELNYALDATLEPNYMAGEEE